MERLEGLALQEAAQEADSRSPHLRQGRTVVSADSSSVFSTKLSRENDLTEVSLRLRGIGGHGG